MKSNGKEPDKNINVNEAFVFMTNPADADIALLGVPFDGTACYRPGSRFGPEAVRREFYGIESYSPYQDRDLTECRIADAGDAEVVFGNTKKTLGNTAKAAAELIKSDIKLLTIGGEHLVSLPVIESYNEKYKDMVVVHFDAHADLREDFLGEQLSHACVMRRVWEKLGDGRIFQMGIRSGTKEEFAFGREHTSLHPFDLKSIEAAIEVIGDRPVYLSVDLDVLDPSEMPGTGTPEAGGVSFTALLKAILALKSCRIVGADAVELAPAIDPSGISTALACKLVREILLVMDEKMPSDSDKRR